MDATSCSQMQSVGLGGPTKAFAIAPKQQHLRSLQTLRKCTCIERCLQLRLQLR